MGSISSVKFSSATLPPPLPSTAIAARPRGAPSPNEKAAFDADMEILHAEQLWQSDVDKAETRARKMLSDMQELESTLKVRLVLLVLI